MTIRPIKSKKDYQNALSRLEEIFDSRPGTSEGDELDILALLIERYETEHYPIEAPDPIEAIKFRMEQMGLKKTDISPLLGGNNRVSEILSRKRALTVEMIRNLNRRNKDE